MKLVVVHTNADIASLAGAVADRVLPAWVAVTAASTGANADTSWAQDLGLTPVASQVLEDIDADATVVHFGQPHLIPKNIESTIALDCTPDAEPKQMRRWLVDQFTTISKSLGHRPRLGVLGGSGFYDLPGLTDVFQREVQTPYGSPSGPLVFGTIGDVDLVFLPRHGPGHHLLPGEVNTRANIWALKKAGVNRIISISAVGSLREEISPGDVVFPDQLIDQTKGRPTTYFGQGVVAHVSMADPICPMLANHLSGIARDLGATVHVDKTYLCIEGPHFASRAESRLARANGADVVGMTNAPEAKLAREAEICYASMTLPTDYDSWRPQDEVRVSDVLATLRANVEKAQQILVNAIATLPNKACTCQSCLDVSLLTPLEAVNDESKLRLFPILARRLGADS